MDRINERINGKRDTKNSLHTKPRKRKRIEIENRELVEEAYSSVLEKNIFENLQNLKQDLKDRNNAIIFPEKSREKFHNIILICQKISAELIASKVTLSNIKIQRFYDLISILASICKFSLSACYEIKNTSFFHNIARIFESSITPTSFKIAILRLLEKIVRHKTAVNILNHHPHIMDRIAQEIHSINEDISVLAVRIFNYMVKQLDSAKAILSSNGCYSAGIFISKSGSEKLLERTDIFQFLYKLSKVNAFRVASQLSHNNEESTKKLLSVFCMRTHTSKNKSLDQWKNLILKWTSLSPDFREALGKRAIDQVLVLGPKLDDSYYLFLSYFMKEPFGRSYLCETGAFDMILSVVSNLQDDKILFQLKLLEGLNEVIFDTNDCLVKICLHAGFLKFAIEKVQKYLMKFTTKCKLEYYNPNEEILDYGATIPVSSSSSKRINEHQALDNSVFSLCNPSALTPSTSSAISSPPRWNISMSPQSAASPTSSSSFLENFFAHSESSGDEKTNLDNLQEEDGSSSVISVFSEGNELEEQGNEVYNSSLKRITHYSLAIISQIAHLNEQFSDYLIRPEILNTLINYISDAESYDKRLARSLIKLAKNERAMESLIEIGLHHVVVKKLVRSDCVLARFSKECFRCSIRKKFGIELLVTLSKQIDTTRGWYNLHSSLSNPETSIEAMKSAVILIRNNNRDRFYNYFKPIEFLVDTIGGLINLYIEREKQSDSIDIAMQCFDILSSLATLINRRGLVNKLCMEIFELNKKTVPHPLLKEVKAENTHCRLVDFSTPTIKFYNKSGELIAQVPKEKLCESSEYFNRMFENDFIENIQNRQEFLIDEDIEVCSQDDFVRFLHLSLGCPLTSDCVKLDSAESYSSILFLADKYMNTSLLDKLFKPEGLNYARAMINGDSLKYFLLICLSVPHIASHFQNTCILVLLRYTNFKQMRETFRYSFQNPLVIQIFVEMILNFLMPFTEPLFNPLISYMDF